MNEEKNQLSKLYAVIPHPVTIDFGEVQNCFYFDGDVKSFKNMGEQKYFNSGIHCIIINASSLIKKI